MTTVLCTHTYTVFVEAVSDDATAVEGKAAKICTQVKSTITLQKQVVE